MIQKSHFWTHIWLLVAAAAAKSLQSCPTLCDPIDGSPPGATGLQIHHEWLLMARGRRGLPGNRVACQQTL